MNPTRRHRWARAATLVLLAILYAVPARAQQPPPSAPARPGAIEAIRFDGTVNTGTGELLSHLSSRVGESLDLNLVTRDIKTLFSLGYFQKVTAEVEETSDRSVILRFVVIEKPRVVSVGIAGNTRVSSEDAFKELSIEVGSFYNKALAEDNAEKIRALYRNKGYLKVRVTAETEAVDANNVRLRFRVEESPRYYVTQIRIRGNHVFTELELKRKMLSAEVDCFDWITDSGVFNEDKINQDLQVIAVAYLERGYVRVFIDRPKITLIHNPEYSRITVELNITEGEQYFLGTQDISGDILGDKQRLLDILGLRSGQVYNALQQNRDTFLLREVYQEQGYAFVQVVPDIRIDDERKIVDLGYRIERGHKAYIGRISFQGNKETRDFVLRREFTVQENELYNGRKLRESQQALLALGYFTPASLRLELEPREDQSVLDVLTKLEESQTGTLQAQIGYSDQSGLVVSGSVSKGNFLGRGQTLRASVQWSQRGVTQNFSLDFIEPRLFDSDYSSDSSLAYRSIEDTTELDRGQFTEIYASQGIGRKIFGPLRLNFALSALNRAFEDPDEPEVKLRTFTTSLIYNTVDHPIFPTNGSHLTMSVAQIGGQLLGGTTEYRRYRMRAQRFFRVNDSGSLVFMGRVRLGWLEQVGDNLIPPEDRFRLGGISSLRGYEYNSVGGPFGRLEQEINSVPTIQLDGQGQPILDSSGQPIVINVDQRTLGFDEATLEQLRGGGTQERLLNLELIFPLAGDNIRGVVFYDAGQINAEQVQYQILGEEEPGFFDLLQTIGAGIRMITPLGVFRLEYGAKLKVRPNESTGRVDFTIGTLF